MTNNTEYAERRAHAAEICNRLTHKGGTIYIAELIAQTGIGKEALLSWLRKQNVGLRSTDRVKISLVDDIITIPPDFHFDGRTGRQSPTGDVHQTKTILHGHITKR